jgi:hypothetical protein
MTGTPAKEKKLSHDEALRLAETRRDRLKSALRHRGIVLPSLSVDAAAYASKSPDVLIELGRCSLEVADKLIEALLEGALDK